MHTRDSGDRMRWQREVFGRHRRAARGPRRQWRRDPVDDFGDIAGEALEVQGSVLKVLRDLQRLLDLRAGRQSQRPRS